MKKINASDLIYVDKSKIKGAGRGVFAKKDIKKGTIIETCPLIEIDKNDTANLSESVLVTYFLYFGKNKNRVGVMLGFGSIYNHSITPNATFEVRTKDNTVEFVAIKNIKKEEEITFDYYHGSNKKNNKDPLWFEKS